MSIGIVFGKYQLRFIRYGPKTAYLSNRAKTIHEGQFPPCGPPGNASDHIGQAYNIMNITTLAIILLLNGFVSLIFDIIFIIVYGVTNDSAPIDFKCSLKSIL